LGDDLGDLGDALRDGDRPAVQEAVGSARENLTELRANLEQTEIRATASQAVAEVRTQLDSISQTVQQFGQGGGSAAQLLQQLAPQLTAMTASLRTLDSQLSSVRCD
jgi:ABC-type transporter Mla subunit MlaD